MISFVLNEQDITTDQSPGMTVLDFVRYHRHLMGTKCGCREGDCGACTVLVGELEGNDVRYRAMTSCLIPLSNITGKHVVTVEGINPGDSSLNAVQEALVAESGTQCGFCTVGFVMSLTAFCLEEQPPAPGGAIAAIDGNICRCTGYKSIERAAERLTTLVKTRKKTSPLLFGIKNKVVPSYFTDIPGRLKLIQTRATAKNLVSLESAKPVFVGGGTDLFVQRPEEMEHLQATYLFGDTSLKGIRQTGDRIEIGANVTVTELMESALLQSIFPRLHSSMKLVSSTSIRNMATVAGNLINASPIGDLSIWLLALNAVIVLQGKYTREVPLKDFFTGYKIMDRQPDEIVTKIYFRRPAGQYYFNFEKVSKRTYLDIASVNTAILLRLEGDTITEAHVSAGGVGPVPLYLRQTAAFLTGKSINQPGELITQANEMIGAEISPISDIRGTAAYKRLLLQQLFYAHFVEMLSLS
jgi:xanthine dehydrogenase small subunit